MIFENFGHTIFPYQDAGVLQGGFFEEENSNAI